MERKYSIDILRILSAIAVIIIHVVTSPLSNSTADIDLHLAANLNLIHTLMNWSVPVFFMITGYCALRKQDCTYKYCFSHVLKYICVLFTVGLFYALLEQVFIFRTLNISIFVQSLQNVISGNIWDHMWFVYAIIGIYLVLPIIHNFMQQRESNIYILTALLFLFNILFPTIEKWLSIGIVLPFDGYLFYVCFGGAVAKIHIHKKLAYLLSLAGLLSIVWIVFGINTQKFDYNHLAVCLMAMSIFVIISKMNVKPNKLILCISNCTWGIYLIHPFFINIAIKLFKIDVLAWQPYANLFVFAVVITLSSLLSAYILRQIPVVKRLF